MTGPSQSLPRDLPDRCSIAKLERTQRSGKERRPRGSLTEGFTTGRQYGISSASRLLTHAAEHEANFRITSRATWRSPNDCATSGDKAGLRKLARKA